MARCKFDAAIKAAANRSGVIGLAHVRHFVRAPDPVGIDVNSTEGPIRPKDGDEQIALMPGGNFTRVLSQIRNRPQGCTRRFTPF